MANLWVRSANERFAFLMALPALLLIGALVLYPLVSSLVMSFQMERNGEEAFVGLRNYSVALMSSSFANALGNTVVFTTLAVGIEVTLGLTLAMLLQAHGARARRLFRSLIILPLMISPTVAALEWGWLYNDRYGLFDYITSKLGFGSPLWLSNPRLALFSIIAVDVWIATPFAVLVFSAALQSIPAEPLEAARVDGANRWQVFRYVQLPFLKPALLVVVLIRAMDAFRVFDIVYILTGGGPGVSTQTLSVYIFQTGFTFLNLERASALSFVMLCMIASVSLGLTVWLRRE